MDGSDDDFSARIAWKNHSVSHSHMIGCIYINLEHHQELTRNRLRAPTFHTVLLLMICRSMQMANVPPHLTGLPTNESNERLFRSILCHLDITVSRLGKKKTREKRVFID